jgi:hypothetical protein
MLESINEEMLESINIPDDLESQTITNKLIAQTTGKNNEIPLKGILKTTSSFAEKEEIEIRNGCIKFCSCIIIIIICVPIIVCDLYFGFTDISCINEIATGLNFTMKIYLLVSGFTEFIAMLITICIVYSLSDNDYKNETILVFVKYFGAVFQIIWNILGAATFWGTIYKEGNCNLNISTYIYISLIVKMVRNLISLRQTLKK